MTLRRDAVTDAMRSHAYRVLVGGVLLVILRGRYLPAIMNLLQSQEFEASLPSR